VNACRLRRLGQRHAPVLRLRLQEPPRLLDVSAVAPGQRTDGLLDRRHRLRAPAGLRERGGQLQVRLDVRQQHAEHVGHGHQRVDVGAHDRVLAAAHQLHATQRPRAGPHKIQHHRRDGLTR
jgi:hypothetical protein